MISSKSCVNITRTAPPQFEVEEGLDFLLMVSQQYHMESQFFALWYSFLSALSSNKSNKVRVIIFNSHKSALTLMSLYAEKNWQEEAPPSHEQEKTNTTMTQHIQTLFMALRRSQPKSIPSCLRLIRRGTCTLGHHPNLSV